VKILKKEESIYTYKKDDNNFINFCPDRGGIITNWISNGKEILYFDKLRFHDKSKSVRGGIPILFPICGSIDGNNSLFGKYFLNLMQHGFARDLKWDFNLNKSKSSLCLSLSDNKFTRECFPYFFDLKIDLFLETQGLNFEVEIKNKSKLTMPVNFGLHPYFIISDFQNIKFLDFPINCQNQKNNTLNLTNNLLKNISNGIDLLFYSNGINSFIDLEFKRQITLINPAPIDLCVIWSDPPRKMLCMEPWTSPRNSLKNGIRLLEISPNTSQKLSTSLLVNSIE